MQLKSVCFVKIYISGCCVDTYLNSSRTDSKEKRCRAEADPSPRPSRGEGGWSLRSLEPPVFPLGAFCECGGPVSVALSWSGLQVRLSTHPPRPSRGEGGWSLRSDVSSFPPVGGRAPCRSVRRFPAFSPRTPCFCNPLKVSS